MGVSGNLWIVVKDVKTLVVTGRPMKTKLSPREAKQWRRCMDSGRKNEGALPCILSVADQSLSPV